MCQTPPINESERVAREARTGGRVRGARNAQVGETLVEYIKGGWGKYDAHRLANELRDELAAGRSLRRK